MKDKAWHALKDDFLKPVIWGLIRQGKTAQQIADLLQFKSGWSITRYVQRRWQFTSFEAAQVFIQTHSVIDLFKK